MKPRWEGYSEVRQIIYHVGTLNHSLGSLILAQRNVSCIYHELGLNPHGNLDALSRITVLLFECILIIDRQIKRLPKIFVF